MQDHQELTNNFHWALKSMQLPCKVLHVSTKNEESFEKIQENFEIFWSTALWKWRFSQFLLNISCISASSPKVYTSGR